MRIKATATALLCMASLMGTTASADPARQAMLVNTCVACHGEAGNSVGPAIPTLAGLSPNYLMGAMLAYKYPDADELEAVIDADPAFEDVEAFNRYGTIMNRLASGYTEEEIKMIAAYFSDQEMQRATQDFDSAQAKKGKKLHTKYCEKCHEDEGRVADDDTGVLAGQWAPYFLYSMADFNNGDRDMPKKMKIKLKEIQDSVGHAGFEQLAHYYASITD